MALRTNILALFCLLVMLSVAPTFGQNEYKEPADGHSDPDAVTGANYFTQSMIKDVTPAGIDVWRIARLPKTDDEPATSYSAYPLTIAQNADIALANASRATLTKFAWLQWGIRCDLCADAFSKKPSSYGGPNIRSAGLPTGTSYTTYDRAIKANLTATLYVLGFPAHARGPCSKGLDFCGYLDAANSAGMVDDDVIAYADAKASPDRYFTVTKAVGNGRWMTTIDKVILPNAKLEKNPSKIWGITCDCEMADGRPASVNTAFLTQMARTVQSVGLKFATGSNDPFGAGAVGGFCGVGVAARNCDVANLADIISAVDAFFVMPGKAPRERTSYETSTRRRIGALGVTNRSLAKKLVMNFVLGPNWRSTSIEDTRAARSLLVEYGFGGVSIVPDFVAYGGQRCRITNIKIAILLGLPTSGC